MKNNGFRGWKDVYSFTFSQMTKRKGYWLFTFLIAVLIVTGIFLAVMIPASKKQKKAEEMPEDKVESLLEEVYIYDRTRIPGGFGEALEGYLGSIYGSTQFFYYNTLSSTIPEDGFDKLAASSDKEAAAVQLYYDTEAQNRLHITAGVPEDAGYDKSEADTLLSHISDYIEAWKLESLTEAQVAEVMMPILASYEIVGENSNVLVTLIKTLAPMFFGVILYVMLLLYGQDIAKGIAMEKVSKLAENLLVSVHPNALIAGKVLAAAAAAMLQFFTWVLSLIGGLILADALAASQFPEYSSTITVVIRFFRDNFSGSALSLPAILLAVLIFCMGFIFFCFLAGMSGCLVSKPEESAGAAGLFSFVVVISWLVPYFMGMSENKAGINIVRYIPLTAPFSVPVDLITGMIGLKEGLIVVLILAVFTFLIIRLSVKVYKGLILYTGQEVSTKLIGKVLKTK